MNLPAGSQGPGIYCVVGGVVYFSLDGGTTWAPTGANVPSATPSAAGLMPAGGLAAFPCAPIDLTTTPIFVQCAPAVAGKTFITHRILFQSTVIAGTLSTAATLEVGQTGSLANIVASSNSQSGGTNFANGVGFVGSANPSVAGLPFLSGVPSGVTVTVAATGTGGFAYTIVVILLGFYL